MTITPSVIPNMSAENVSKMLVELRACSQAIRWASDKDLKTIWLTCDRADWLIWLLAKQEGKINWPNSKQITLAICTCARIGLTHVKSKIDRLEKALELAEKWAIDKEVNISDLAIAINDASIIADDASAGYCKYQNKLQLEYMYIFYTAKAITNAVRYTYFKGSYYLNNMNSAAAEICADCVNTAWAITNDSTTVNILKQFFTVE